MGFFRDELAALRARIEALERHKAQIEAWAANVVGRYPPEPEDLVYRLQCPGCGHWLKEGEYALHVCAQTPTLTTDDGP